MTTHASWRRGGLAVLLLALGVAGCSAQATPTATPSPSASLSPQPSLEPTATPSSPPTIPTVAWRAADAPDTPELSSIIAIVSGLDGRIVAIGFDGGFGSILWSSDDTQAWADVTPDDFVSAGLAGVTRLGDLVVAVGRGDTIDVDANLAAVYLSDDGLTWRRSAMRVDGQLIDVVATDDALYAVGGVPTGDSAGVWQSADGETWERAGADLERAFLWSIAEGGPGLVAVGWRRNPEPDLAVWTSTDGADWTLAPDPEGFEGFEATDVISTPDGTLVMAGSAFDGSGGRIWTSTDGVAWELGAFDPDGGAARSLAWSPQGIIAVGSREMDAMTWISADDGASWQPLGDPIPNAYLNAAHVTDGGLVLLVGGTQEGTPETGISGRAMIWSGSLD